MSDYYRFTLKGTHRGLILPHPLKFESREKRDVQSYYLEHKNEFLEVPFILKYPSDTRRLFLWAPRGPRPADQADGWLDGNLCVNLYTDWVKRAMILPALSELYQCAAQWNEKWADWY